MLEQLADIHVELVKNKKDMYEALNKLYYSRDMQTRTVFSVVLNPLT